jgi:hypothetical protein
MEFDEKQKSEIETLAALNYTVKQIAIYLDVPAYLLYQEFANEDSVFRYHYERGKLSAQVKIDKANFELAKIGNSFATMRYDKKEKDARAKEAKHRIFGSS